jgi:hypothetical protein
VGSHGIAWEDLGRQRNWLLFGKNRSKISRLLRHLPATARFHSRQIYITKIFALRSCEQPCGAFRGKASASPGVVGQKRRRKGQTACKPGSVRPKRRDDHSSGTHLTMRLTRPTRAARQERLRNNHVCDLAAAPIRSCSRWGLPCRPCCQGRGALLPHPFALARGADLLTQASLARAVYFLWHFPWGRPRRPLAGTVFPWSPDFPPPAGLPRWQQPSGCLASGMCAPTSRRSSIRRSQQEKETIL